MNSPGHGLRALLAALFVLAVVASGPSAQAGVLKIRDDAHALSSDDVARLRHVVADEPFDGRLLVTDDYADGQELSRVVGSLVTEPSMVAVGLDPRHRHVEVHFGTQSGVPRADWPAIERAGNDAFRRGDWAGGVAAVFQAASASVSPSAPVQPPAASAQPSLLGPGVLLLVLLGVIGVAAIAFSRRRAIGGSPYDGGYGPPGYGGGYYGPGSGGVGPLGGGIIGAGLGGLAGYELGKLEGEREERDRERGGGWGAASSSDDDGGNYDAGGGGSSWDDGGSDGGSDGGGGGGGSDF